jgi:predicted aspartyl protease
VIRQIKLRLADFHRSRFFVARGAVLHHGNKVVLDFLVDTGSALTLIPTAAFQKLNIPAFHQMNLTGIGMTGGPHQVGIVERIHIGSASASDVVVAGVDLAHELKVDALLGGSFLQHFTLTADYRQARLLLED